MSRDEMNHDDLRVEQEATGDGLTVHLSGRLVSTTYRSVRDAVLKAALDEPAALVIDVSNLDVPAPSAWSVFTSARWMIKDWPEVPLALVCSVTESRRALQRMGVARYVPVYGRTDVAIAALRAHPQPPRRRVRQVWSADHDASRFAQRFVAHWLTEWSMRDRIATARIVSTILVRNVLVHTDSPPDLRLEAWDGTVVVAVADDSTDIASIREDDEHRGSLTGLRMVDALTRVWGSTPTASGKVVWAVIGPENRL